MLPYFEQSAMYNAVNFNLLACYVDNATICGVQVNSLICPSDINNSKVLILANSASNGTLGNPGWSFDNYNIPPGIYYQAFSSYAGNAGTFDFGYNQATYATTSFAQYNGVIYNDSVVRIASITDGTSNTFIFGEHSHGKLLLNDWAYGVSDNSWNSGRWYDTLFATFYPPNVPCQPPGTPGYTGLFGSTNNYYYPTVATSFHPGGVNTATLRRIGAVHQELDFKLELWYRRRPARQLAQWRDLGRRPLRLHDQSGHHPGPLSTALDPQLRRSHQLRRILIRLSSPRA